MIFVPRTASHCRLRSAVWISTLVSFLLPLSNCTAAATNSNSAEAEWERIAFNESFAVRSRTEALAKLPPEVTRRHVEPLTLWAAVPAHPLGEQAVWSLGFAGGPQAAASLQALVGRFTLPDERRADALMARAMAMSHDVEFAEAWLDFGPKAVRKTARFILGKSRASETTARPTNTKAWQRAAAKEGDARHGRRLFFSPQLACARCHVAENRGAPGGMDLTGSGRRLESARLVESILEPSRELAPGFEGYEVENKGGDILTGLKGTNVNGTISLIRFDGQVLTVASNQVAGFRKLPNSLMPEGLVEGLSVSEFRDLIAYLNTL